MATILNGTLLPTVDNKVNGFVSRQESFYSDSLETSSPMAAHRDSAIDITLDEATRHAQLEALELEKAKSGKPIDDTLFADLRRNRIASIADVVTN